MPNILWYCTDQQRFDTIAALGNPHIHTPNLDRLVAEGTAFTHAYCQSPICTPSRASFLTGRYPSTIRVTGNGNASFPANESLVTRRLADAGYSGGLVGKLHLAAAYYGREARVEDGYEVFQYSHAPRHDWKRGHDYAEWLDAQEADARALLAVRPDQYGVCVPTEERDNVPPHLHQTAWCTEQAISFVSERPDRPWVLSVNPYDPHPPYNPPWDYFRRYDPATLPGPHFRESDLAHQSKLSGVDFQTAPQPPDAYDGAGGRTMQALYYAMIEQIDTQFGRLLDALDASGQRENTIVIFMSDHGEALGDHGLAHKGCRFFEELTRAPLIWSWPGHIASGVQSDALVELLDVAPTLLEFSGLPVPATMQGRSLRPILTGEASPNHHRDFVRCEYYDAIDEPHHSYATMYRDRRYKLNVYHDIGFGELYDLTEDPHEFDSRWDDPECQAVKTELLLKSFDATVHAAVPRQPRIAQY
jgi:arylsulfatase A-like enzyme